MHANVCLFLFFKYIYYKAKQKEQKKTSLSYYLI